MILSSATERVAQNCLYINRTRLVASRARLSIPSKSSFIASRAIQQLPFAHLSRTLSTSRSPVSRIMAAAATAEAEVSAATNPLLVVGPRSELNSCFIALHAITARE